MNNPDQHMDTPEVKNIEREIRNRMEHLRSYCQENGRQLIIIADSEGNEDGRYTCVWSITNSKHEELNAQNFSELMGPFIHSVDSFVRAATGGACAIVPLKKEE